MNEKQNQESKYTINPNLISRILELSKSKDRPMKDRLKLLQDAIQTIIDNPDSQTINTDQNNTQD